MKTVRRPPYPKWNPGYFPCSSLTPPSAFLTPSIGVLRWIRAKVIQHYPIPEDILKHQGLELVTTSKRIREEITRLAGVTVGIPGVFMEESIRAWAEYLATVDDLINRYTVLITEAVKDHVYGSVLLSFPYVGPLRAAVLIGIIQDINRWATSRKLKKAFGLYGVERQSGEHAVVRRGRSGHPEGKTVLFQIVANSLRQRGSKPNDFLDYYDRQKRASKPTMKAMYKTAAKVLEIIYHCLEKGVDYKFTGVYRQ